MTLAADVAAARCAAPLPLILEREGKRSERHADQLQRFCSVVRLQLAQSVR